jgi:hypothetical protein
MPIDRLLDALFDPSREPGSRWLVRAWLSGLFLSGLFTWAYFFAFGAAALDFHDWADITIPRLAFMQQALTAGELPLHLSLSNALHGVTERYLTIPDVVTTPQTLLLLVMPISRFVIADVLIHYSIGFAGLLLVRRYFDWSLYTFSVVFLLVLFNGHILAHYSVGHFTWGAYFLFPIAGLLVFRFLDGDDSWRSVAQFAAIMFYMVLAGGQHHMTWILLLLLALLPFCWSRAWWIVAVAVSSVLLSAVRLLPPALELESFRRSGLFTSVTGYPSVWHLLESLVRLRRETPGAVPGLPANLQYFDQNHWEFNVYIGAVGAAFVACGVYQWLRAESPRYRQLVVPMFAVVALSMGSVLRIVRWSGVPLLQGERATSRMFGLVLVLLVIVAAGFVDRYLRASGQTWRQRALAGAALVFLVLDISASVRLERVAISSGLFGPSAFNASNLAHRADPAYVAVLAAGLAITIATAATLTVLTRREARAGRSPAAGTAPAPRSPHTE